MHLKQKIKKVEITLDDDSVVQYDNLNGRLEIHENWERAFRGSHKIKRLWWEYTVFWTENKNAEEKG